MLCLPPDIQQLLEQLLKYLSFMPLKYKLMALNNDLDDSVYPVCVILESFQSTCVDPEFSIKGPPIFPEAGGSQHMSFAL